MIIALKLLIVVVWVGGRRLEIRLALHQRDPTDGEQHPVNAVQVDQARPLPRLPGGPASVACSPPSWRTCAGTIVEIVAPLVLLFSPNRG